MSEGKVYRAIGLMSGTSLDGSIDVALIETDGHDFVRPLAYYEHPYDLAVRDKVRACFGKLKRDDLVDEAEALVTDLHVAAIKGLGEKADVIGFHGQTITHDPSNRFTWQIGDGARLAQETGMDVLSDMRQADIKAGGQGAPLLPLYHKALLSDVDLPVVVLNLGGVANITYIGEDGGLIAFDCGPANALMDDFMKMREGVDFDKDGAMASQGQVQDNIITAFMSDKYFAKKPPKSLDRNQWDIDCVRYASDEDGMATLLEMTVSGIMQALEHLPQKPRVIYAAGGGRKNLYLLEVLAQRLGIQVISIDTLGWNGDAIEAEGFAYLAVRSLLGLPLTLPSTTGVPEALTGGVFFPALKG